MQIARTNLHTFSGEYCRVPPDLSKQRNLDFSSPNDLSITTLVFECEALYFSSAVVFGSSTGVKSQGLSGYPLSPAITFKENRCDIMIPGIVDSYQFSLFKPQS